MIRAVLLLLLVVSAATLLGLAVAETGVTKVAPIASARSMKAAMAVRMPLLSR